MDAMLSHIMMTSTSSEARLRARNQLTLPEAAARPIARLRIAPDTRPDHAAHVHLDAVGLPRERRLRAGEVRLPHFRHRRLAAQRRAVAEEHRRPGQMAAEGRKVALGHAAGEGTLGALDLALQRRQIGLRHHATGEQHGQGRQADPGQQW